MTTTEKQQRAIQRAQINGGAQAAIELRRGTFRVIGRGGDRYTVRATSSTFQCDCPAGMKNCPCWHAAAVWLRLLAENRLAAPAVTPVCKECGKPSRHIGKTGCCPKCLLWG